MIRQATHEDIPVLIDLGEVMHAESPRFSRLRFSREKLATTLHQLLISPDGFLWVAESDEGVFGGMAAIVGAHWASEDRIASDLALFIDPQHRGGLAVLRLINRFRWWAREKKASIVQVGLTTGVNTEDTARLLERLGLTRCGVILEDI